MKAHFSLLVLSLLGACSGGSGSGGSGGTQATGTLELIATDSPLDHSLVQSASIDFVKIRVHRNANAQSGFVTVYDGPPFTIQLDALRNGITRGLASGVLEAGTYSQVRLHLSGARLELKNGNVYSTADGTLKLTSQSTSGYKVFLSPPVEVPPNGVATVLLDIDLTKSFVPIPANDPENAREYHLQPVLRAVAMEGTGELRVTVLEDVGGVLVGVADATVYVLPPGEQDPANSVASTATDADGSGAVLALLPGSYDVLATMGTRSDRENAVSISAGAVTSIELVLP